MIDGDNTAPLDLCLEEMDLLQSILVKYICIDTNGSSERKMAHDILNKLSIAREDLQLSIDEN